MTTPLTTNQENLLKKLYYEDKNFFGRQKLFELVKNLENHPTQRQVQDWLHKQETYQLHYLPKKTTSVKAIVSKKPNLYYQIDLVDMGNDAFKQYRYIMTVIDVFTKQLYAVPMRKKAVKSIINAFNKIYQKIKDDGKEIKIIQHDEGSEFISDEFKNLMQQLGIKQLIGISGRPQSQGIIERYNGILKGLIMKDKTATGHKDWPDSLQTYVNNINNSYQRTIKTIPNIASENSKEVYENLRKQAIKHAPQINKNLEINDKVRVKIFKGKLDKFSKPNWSKETYKIYKVKKSHKPYIQTTYILEDNDGDIIDRKYQGNDLLLANTIEKY